jgi:hypothetical protein
LKKSTDGLSQQPACATQRIASDISFEIDFEMDAVRNGHFGAANFLHSSDTLLFQKKVFAEKFFT